MFYVNEKDLIDECASQTISMIGKKPLICQLEDKELWQKEILDFELIVPQFFEKVCDLVAIHLLGT